MSNKVIYNNKPCDNSEPKQVCDISTYSKLVMIAGLASTSTAGVLIISKLMAFVLTGSSTLMASLTDSLMDVAASVVNLLALKYAVTPSDEDHRYGHWKAESVSSLIQSAFIVGSSVFLVVHGCMRFATPVELDSLDTGIWVTIFAITISIVLVMLQTYVVKKTHSQAIMADRLHYASDILFNIGVLVSLGFSYFGYLRADGLFAIILGMYIFSGGFKIGKSALSVLLDEQLSDNDIIAIHKEILSVPNILGVHDLRTRKSGPVIFVQAHVVLDENISLREAHEAADLAESNVLKLYPNADLTLHMEPVPTGTEKERL